MADSPPPLDDVEIAEETLKEPAVDTTTGGEPAVDTTTGEEPEQDDDLFADALQSPEVTPSESKAAENVPEPEPSVQEPPKEAEPAKTEEVRVPPPTLEPTVAIQDESPEVSKKTPSLVETEASKPMDLFGEDTATEGAAKEQEKEEEEEEEEDESGDTFDFIITVSDPAKMGDGMGAYIAYTVSTKTSMPSFKNPECTVKRRFSDFLGLGHRVSEKYTLKGCIVPPAPEKSVVGMTKVKFSKSEENTAGFLERRRAALERYLNRLAKHPVLRKDDDFREFLENPDELPKSSDTAALSGAGFMRLVKNVGESISKIAGKKADADSWFEEQEQNFEALDSHLKKLHAAIESMTICRKDLCGYTDTLAKSVATLGNVEENDTISRALARLSEVEEKVEDLHNQQFDNDLFVFGETIKDYVALLASIKLNFQARVKAYNTWQSAQSTLAKKRENEVKLQTAGKTEKLPQAKTEIEEWEKKVEEGQKNFDRVSKVLKREVKRFEVERAQEFKQKFIEYLESLMKLQQQLIKLWEDYLPDAQAIA